MDFTKLDYENDKVDAYIPPLSPDGPVDPPQEGEPTGYRWSGVFIDPTTLEETDAATSLEVRGDGLAAILRLPTDQAAGRARIVVRARVDKADTTEVEEIFNTYNLGWAHSKATSLGGSAPDSIAKGAPFPS